MSIFFRYISNVLVIMDVSQIESLDVNELNQMLIRLGAKFDKFATDLANGSIKELAPPFADYHSYAVLLAFQLPFLPVLTDIMSILPYKMKKYWSKMRGAFAYIKYFL